MHFASPSPKPIATGLCQTVASDHGRKVYMETNRYISWRKDIFWSRIMRLLRC